MPVNLNRRAQSLFPRFGDYVNRAPQYLQMIAAYAAQNPGLEYGNYCSGWNDKEGRAAYFSESRSITKDLQRVRDAVRESCFMGVTDADITEASGRAFSGRLTITPNSIDYCTGQYWPTEYRSACASVLEAAIRIAQRRQQPIAA